MKSKVRRGSITVFATLLCFLVSQVLFVMVESARQKELRKIYEMQTNSAMESLFAGYVTPLWERYRILGLDGGSKERFLSTACTELSRAAKNSGNAHLGNNYLEVQVKKVLVDKYTLLVDGDGDVFCAAVANYMKDNITYETARSVYEIYKEFADLQKYNNNLLVPNAQSIEDIELLQELDKIQTAGVLELVIQDTSKISGKAIDSTRVLSARNKMKGEQPTEPTLTWYEEVLFQQYLLGYFQNFCDVEDKTGLCYEQEYLLCGKDSDASNLEATLEQLVAIRTSANLLYLLSDSEKMAIAETLAITLCSLVMLPEAAEPVKYVLLGGWAYVEAILDARALIEGKTIPLWKTCDTWTSDLEGLGGLISGTWVVAKESEVGLDYEGYIGTLLFFQGRKRLSFRAMDLMELYVREVEGYSDFQMDHVLYDATISILYEEDGLFYPVGQLEYSNQGFYEYRIP